MIAQLLAVDRGEAVLEVRQRRRGHVQVVHVVLRTRTCRETTRIVIHQRGDIGSRRRCRHCGVRRCSENQDALARKTQCEPCTWAGDNET